jgi:hypothetical protein
VARILSENGMLEKLACGLLGDLYIDEWYLLFTSNLLHPTGVDGSGLCGCCGPKPRGPTGIE